MDTQEQAEKPKVPAIVEVDGYGQWSDCHYYCSEECRQEHLISVGGSFNPYKLDHANDYIKGAICEFCDVRLLDKAEKGVSKWK